MQFKFCTQKNPDLIDICTKLKQIKIQYEKKLKCKKERKKKTTHIIINPSKRMSVSQQMFGSCFIKIVLIHYLYVRRKQKFALLK